MHGRPRWELARNLVLKILKVYALESSDRQGKAKVPQGERCPDRREILKDVIKVLVGTTDGRN